MNKLKAALIISNLQEGDLLYEIIPGYGEKDWQRQKIARKYVIGGSKTFVKCLDGPKCYFKKKHGCRKQVKLRVSPYQWQCFEVMTQQLIKKKLVVVRKEGKKYVKVK